MILTYFYTYLRYIDEFKINNSFKKRNSLSETFKCLTSVSDLSFACLISMFHML